MDPSSNSFQQNFILFQTLSKKRSIHLRNINNSKNNLLTNLKGKLQTYSSSVIKVNEFANNKNSFNEYQQKIQDLPQDIESFNKLLDTLLFEGKK